MLTVVLGQVLEKLAHVVVPLGGGEGDFLKICELAPAVHVRAVLLFLQQLDQYLVPVHGFYLQVAETTASEACDVEAETLRNRPSTAHLLPTVVAVLDGAFDANDARLAGQAEARDGVLLRQIRHVPSFELAVYVVAVDPISGENCRGSIFGVAAPACVVAPDRPATRGSSQISFRIVLQPGYQRVDARLSCLLGLDDGGKLLVQ